MSGVLHLQAKRGSEGAPRIVFVAVSKVESRAWRKCFSFSLTHTHLSLQRDSSAARRVRAAGLATRQSARVCATGDGWMARMYVQDV